MELPQQPREKILKDGIGPRGVPDCYYTSRVLNSTFNYVKFVKRLRVQEEEERIAKDVRLNQLRVTSINNFFVKCDRKSLINKVAKRVDLCFASYQEDLIRKKKRLMEIYAVEEEANVRLLVENVQAGADAVWQNKKNRLQYLLAKRKKEHEEKYKDLPLSKCVHVYPCVFKLRAKEAEIIQLYQIKEKEARKMAENEYNKMWHEVAMNESDALAARMEHDAIERLRRDIECKQYTDYQLQQQRMKREKEREMLKQETLWLKSIWEQEEKKEEEAERKRAAKRAETTRERNQMIEERRETVARQQAEAKMIADTWDSLTGQGIADEVAKEEMRRKKERELDACNKKLMEMKAEYIKFEMSNEPAIQEEGRRQQQITDEKRCQYISWSKKTNRDVRKAMIDQIKDRQEAKDLLKKEIDKQDEYNRHLFGQIQELVGHKRVIDAQHRKKYQNERLEQVEYSRLLKERARQEELEQIKKGQIAAAEYQQEIEKMLCRPFFSDHTHPFMKQMSKELQLREKCPCSKPNYCK